MPAIPDERRRPEAEVWRAFDAAAPGILALLLDGLATAQRLLPDLKLDRLPRMADFARLACAAAPAFGWSKADMLAALDTNRADAVSTVIEADPIAVAVRDIAEAGAWEGTATDLLDVIRLKVSPEMQRERGFPKDGARLSTRLKRVAPALRRAGVARRDGEPVVPRLAVLASEPEPRPWGVGVAAEVVQGHGPFVPAGVAEDRHGVLGQDGARGVARPTGVSWQSCHPRTV